MKNTLVIAWKETRTYFVSPMAYIVMAVYAALAAYYFVTSISGVLPEATIRGYILPTTFIFTLLSPIITMRLLAEEQKLGTLELLMTSPVRDYEIVMGKFLASMTSLISLLVPTAYLAIVLVWFASPDMGPMLSGYLGIIFFGMATLSVGLFASSLSGNQIVAAVVAMGILLLLSIIDLATSYVGSIFTEIFLQISITTHLESFARGVIDTHDMVFYLIFTTFMLFLTVRSLESRRWR
ncbi:MAG: ABC transporter permease [Dehalococcoidia bacterium]|jgi:ABC-2 type transport system permease protein|nr:ABC transporter permease [Dehalococcoidia bacterium]